MDIAALSSIMAQSKVQQQVGIQLSSKVMDVAKQQSDALMKIMESGNAIEKSVTPYLGGNIDIKL